MLKRFDSLIKTRDYNIRLEDREKTMSSGNFISDKFFTTDLFLSQSVNSIKKEDVSVSNMDLGKQNKSHTGDIPPHPHNAFTSKSNLKIKETTGTFVRNKGKKKTTFKENYTDFISQTKNYKIFENANEEQIGSDESVENQEIFKFDNRSPLKHRTVSDENRYIVPNPNSTLRTVINHKSVKQKYDIDNIENMESSNDILPILIDQGIGRSPGLSHVQSQVLSQGISQGISQGRSQSQRLSQEQGSIHGQEA